MRPNSLWEAVRPLVDYVFFVGGMFLLVLNPWLLLVVVVLGVMAMAYFKNTGIKARERQRKEAEEFLQRQPCPHGVPGGRSKGLCDECRKEREQEALRAEYRRRAAVLERDEAHRHAKLALGTIEYLRSLQPREFEDAVSEMFRALGYVVRQTPYSNDRGRDAVMVKDGDTFALECKRYGHDKDVGRPDLQKFFAAMSEVEAKKGFFVTTGRFSHTAVEYAGRNNIELIGPEKLVFMMKIAFPPTDDSDVVKAICTECGDLVSIGRFEADRPCSNGHLVKNYLLASDLLSRPFGPPRCEKCGRPMKVVTGRRGPFWGCTGYPECRNIKSYEGQNGNPQPTASSAELMGLAKTSSAGSDSSE